MIVDKSSSIHAENITVASGHKCKYCGVIRPYDRPDCFCEESKLNRNKDLKEKQNKIKKILKKVFD